MPRARSWFIPSHLSGATLIERDANGYRHRTRLAGLQRKRLLRKQRQDEESDINHVARIISGISRARHVATGRSNRSSDDGPFQRSVILFELPPNSITRPFVNLCPSALARAGASALRYPQLELSPLHFNQHRERSVHSGLRAGSILIPCTRRISQLRPPYPLRLPSKATSWSNTYNVNKRSGYGVPGRSRLILMKGGAGRSLVIFRHCESRDFGDADNYCEMFFIITMWNGQHLGCNVAGRVSRAIATKNAWKKLNFVYAKIVLRVASFLYSYDILKVISKIIIFLYYCIFTYKTRDKRCHLFKKMSLFKFIFKNYIHYHY